MVLKNRSNKIRSNEIHIRRELPVAFNRACLVNILKALAEIFDKGHSLSYWYYLVVADSDKVLCRYLFTYMHHIYYHLYCLWWIEFQCNAQFHFEVYTQYKYHNSKLFI